MKYVCLSIALTITLIASAFANEDILVADFEGETYGEWKAEGDAFGFGNVPMVNTTSGWVGDLGPSGANLTPDGWYLDYNYNDQNLIAVVPEPTSLVLLSLGLVAVAIASMRRRTHRTANPDDSWRA
jgi:hypothetical protein